MKFGLFCGYDNPNYDYLECFEQQTRLVREAEALGLEEAWLGERHFNADGVCPSILVLLGHLSGVTSRIRLGTAVLLLAYRDPIQVAEDLATIDNLSRGRLNLGAAKGGLFTTLSKQFGVEKSAAREKTLEALTFINRLLHEENVTHESEGHKVSNLTITPRPVQKPIPTWIGSTQESAISYAAEHGFGVMGPVRTPVPALRAIVDTYARFAPQGDPGFTVVRFFHAAPSREQALAEARPFFHRATVRAQKLVQEEKMTIAPDPDDEALMARMLIGSYGEVADKIEELRREVPMRCLVLSPATTDFTAASRSLAMFAERIRPALAD